MNKKIPITIVLIFAMAFSLFAFPFAIGHDPPWNIPTNAYVTTAPSRIGLGQYTVIVVFLDRYSPTAGGLGGQRLNGYKIEITKPDGNKETIGPWQCSSDVGSDFQVYTPDQLGTYTIVFSFAGDTITIGEGSPQKAGLPYLGDYFEPSTSEPTYLEVTNEPRAEWQEPSLPTEYWQRPIHAANRGWSPLASNWLKGSWLVDDFQRGGTVPKSAHIMWTEPLVPNYQGGISDARWPSMPSDANDYESPWSDPIIMNGIIYYSSPDVADSQRYGYYAVDLYTGETLWYKNGTDNGMDPGNPYTIRGLDSSSTQGAPGQRKYGGLSFGTLKYWYGVNGQGVFSYLVYTVYRDPDAAWYFLDPATGNLIFTMINVPGGTSVTDQDGNLLKYTYNRNTGTIQCWNCSHLIGPGSPVSSLEQQWKPVNGYVYDATNDTLWTNIGPNTLGQTEWTERDVLPRTGITMNVSSPSLAGLPGGISQVCQDENYVPKMIFGSSFRNLGGLSTTITEDNFNVWLVRIDEHAVPYSPFPDGTATINSNLGFEATLVYNKQLTVPLPGKNYTWSLANVDYISNTFQILSKQTSQIWTYSLDSGTLLWGPTVSFNAFDFYSLSATVKYGQLLLRSQYGGWLAGYDIETGDLNWVYNATGIGYESAYGDNMPLSTGAIVDGCIILYSGEHSPTKPLWRESCVRAVNLTDGTLVWKLLDFSLGVAVADGYVVTASQYDNRILCIGKGPSATTVTASPKVSVHGSSVLVEGMIKDISPGTEKYTQTARFANGVPAIADEDMSPWMEYLYMQQPKPTEATGVEVVISVLDPNNNFYEVGRTTSDVDGNYKLMFEPLVPGEYSIIASFEGSESYWPSYAKTAIGVAEAPAATPMPTPPPASVADIYLLPSVAGIIVAIVVIGIVLILMLRKR